MGTFAKRPSGWVLWVIDSTCSCTVEKTKLALGCLHNQETKRLGFACIFSDSCGVKLFSVCWCEESCPVLSAPAWSAEMGSRERTFHFLCEFISPQCKMSLQLNLQKLHQFCLCEILLKVRCLDENNFPQIWNDRNSRTTTPAIDGENGSWVALSASQRVQLSLNRTQCVHLGMKYLCRRVSTTSGLHPWKITRINLL